MLETFAERQCVTSIARGPAIGITEWSAPVNSVKPFRFIDSERRRDGWSSWSHSALYDRALASDNGYQIVTWMIKPLMRAPYQCRFVQMTNDGLLRCALLLSPFSDFWTPTDARCRQRRSQRITVVGCLSFVQSAFGSAAHGRLCALIGRRGVGEGGTTHSQGGFSWQTSVAVAEPPGSVAFFRASTVFST